VSRKRGDRLNVFERTVEVIVDEPGPGFDELRRRVGARDQDVRRVLRGLRAVRGLPLPDGRPGRPRKPLPFSQSGDCDVGGGAR
jgi:hypothetical protein